MKIFPIICTSAVLLHFTCDCSTRIEYPGVSNDYHFQKALFLQSGEPDPILKRDKKSLQKICQQVRESNSYRMIKLDDYTNLPEVIKLGEDYSQLSAEVEKNEWKEGLRYVKTQVFLQVNEDISATDAGITLFSCATKDGIRYFHLTYGFLDGYFFVFNPLYTVSEDRTDMEVKLTGLIQPDTAKLMEFRNRRHMEKVFQNSMNIPKSGIEIARDRLCDLNANQQFRLCVAVYDALNPSKLFINFTKNIGYRCMKGWVIEGAQAQNTDDTRKYLTLKQQVDVLPCFINSDYTPNFYLTADPVQETSVYVLSAPKNMPVNPTEELSGGITLLVEHSVKDVPVLKHAKTFYL